MAESTLKLDNDTNKLTTGNFGNSNISKAKDIMAPKTLSLWMSRQEAQNNGILALFDSYNINTNGNSKERIDDMEYAAYRSGRPITKEYIDNQSKKDIEELSNIRTAKQFLHVTKKSLETLGIDEKITTEIDRLKNNPNKKDLETLAKEQFGIDLSQYKTDEEKQKAITDAINSKYKYDADDENSVYAQHLKRLKEGKLTKGEIELLGGRTEITDEEQLKKFAQMATDADAIVDVTKFFASGDFNAQKALVSSLGDFKSNIQTGLLAIAIYASDDIGTRKLFADILANQELKLTDRNKKIFDFAMYALHRHVDVKTSMKFDTNRNNFETASAQTAAFMMADVAEKDKVKHGELSQEEYDNNYVNVYAASAHMIQEASQAYQYVMDNANDENRSGTMDMLASTAYQIQDGSERNKAINSIQNSPYYNDNTAKNLNAGFDNHIAQELGLSPQKNNDFSNIVSQAFKNDDEKSVKKQNEIIDKTFSDLEEKNSTPERQRMSRARGIQLLNILIKENKIQGSIHEAKIINKLQSLPVQTLVTLMCSLNSNAQNYFVKKKIITIEQLNISMSKADQRNLSDKIQDKLKEIRTETTGQNLNIDYA